MIGSTRSAPSTFPVGRVVVVEGNLVAEDCGIASRRLASSSPEAFTRTGYGEFLAELRASSAPAIRAWADWYAECAPEALHAAARSLVAWSDGGRLLDAMSSLPATAYLHGDETGFPNT